MKPGVASDSLMHSRTCAAHAGVKLLQCMGWRQGKGMGTRGIEDDSSTAGKRTRRGWGRVAGVGVENTPIYALPPKTDAHGLGFDPFKVCVALQSGVCSCLPGLRTQPVLYINLFQACLWCNHKLNLNHNPYITQVC